MLISTSIPGALGKLMILKVGSEYFPIKVTEENGLQWYSMLDSNFGADGNVNAKKGNDNLFCGILALLIPTFLSLILLTSLFFRGIGFVSIYVSCTWAKPSFVH